MVRANPILAKITYYHMSNLPIDYNSIMYQTYRVHILCVCSDITQHVYNKIQQIRH